MVLLIPEFTNWSYPLCITLVVGVVLLSIFLLWKFNSDGHWDLPLSTMWGANAVSPFLLAIFRIVTFLYITFIGLAFLIRTSYGLILLPVLTSSFVNLRFFTVWNWTLLNIYFGIAAYYSFRGLLFFRKNRHFQESDTIGVGGKIFVVLHQICAPMTLLVDIILWGVLLPMAKQSDTDLSVFFNFWSYNQHALNFILMALEFAFCQLPYFPSHCLFSLIWACYYVIFSWAYFALGGTWAYPFLEPRVWEAPLWYLGISVLVLIFFFIWYGFYRLKLRIWPVLKEQSEVEAYLHENDPLRSTTTDY